MELEWSVYWQEFLRDEKLQNKVNEINEVYHSQDSIETICHQIYDDYDKLYLNLCSVRHDIEEYLSKINDIHLKSNRIKRRNSLIRKVIEKMHKSCLDPSSPYSSISKTNYRDVVTDLIGLRFIINYRGKWIRIHNELLKIFKLYDIEEYKKNSGRLPLDIDEAIIAEWPRAYVDKDDDQSIYEKNNIDVEVHKKGYRSIHYILGYKNTYIELQVRTIYDEAWSDCDHNYVYKHQSNPNNAALSALSQILNQITNAANDIGEMMYDIYNEDKFKKQSNGKWIVAPNYFNIISTSLNRIETAKDKLMRFNDELDEEVKNNDD